MTRCETPYAKQVARGNDMIPIGLGDPSMHGLPSLNAAQAASGYSVPAAPGAGKKGGGNGKGGQKPPGGGKDGSGASGNAAVNPNAKAKAGASSYNAKELEVLSKRDNSIKDKPCGPCIWHSTEEGCRKGVRNAPSATVSP